MGVGILYIHSERARCNWIQQLLDELKLDVEVKYGYSPQFEKDFPLKKFPAFISTDGWKLSETPAILQYLIALSPQNEMLSGITNKEKAKVLQWVSFFSQDFVNAIIMIVIHFKNDSDRRQGWIKIGKNFLEYVDQSLANGCHLWLATEYITIADIHAYKCLKDYAPILGGTEKYCHIEKFMANLERVAPVYKDKIVK